MSGADELVPLHPEPVDGEPTRLRWVAPAERMAALGFVGAPAQVPDDLAPLLADGTLEDVTVTPTAVVAALAPGRSWRTEGARVRSALQAALADPSGWRAPAGADPDDALRMAVDEVIAGEVGDYVRSHGGELTLLSAHDDRVEVSMTGTCGHCPAADDTLTTRVETALRARYPALREVVARVGVDAVPAGRRRLPLLPLRRP
ncbi:NifU family protein [Lapillicoccus jejuensis]|uniref:Fe-S cluster biogenesis protein NfuA n=1 Tax=Lapillicoccus jejuensis TaxID=402171 RepID=A0A542DZZ2_9MICO|nr:NifU family protein [Lapillicoccus jejuensis]TQJ08653.1 Fe-S cluster biogenesis protein NfuA [Lapillicoccus jejuensis]